MVVLGLSYTILGIKWAAATRKPAWALSAARPASINCHAGKGYLEALTGQNTIGIA
jgi:hypothetical protein